jgi:spermidine synthase
LAPLAILTAVLTVADPRQLPLVRLNAAAGERLLEVRESAYGVTAVVARGAERRIKVNNYYSLGGSGSVEHERNQALLPLLAHPQPGSIFFLGLGSGITAGAALQPPVQRLVVAELIPDVIDAARAHFGDVTNRLFSDPRVRIVADDGRNFLAATSERFDLVIADLFVPWEAGTGGLYTLEHFRTARARLTERGAFVQWLPLYQMSQTEFMTVARTMLAVFPHVSLWRGDFFPERPIVALAGTTTRVPLDPERIARRGAEIAGRPVPGSAVRALVLPFYAGDLSRARRVVADGPLNTDDRPIIEYAAPITQRQQRAGAARWFTSVDLLDFFRRVLEASPPGDDPLLAAIEPHERAWVEAGYHYHAAAVYRVLDRGDLARSHLREFEARVPPPFRQPSRAEPTDRVAEWDLGSD